MMCSFSPLILGKRIHVFFLDLFYLYSYAFWQAQTFQTTRPRTCQGKPHHSNTAMISNVARCILLGVSVSLKDSSPHNLKSIIPICPFWYVFFRTLRLFNVSQGSTILQIHLCHLGRLEGTMPFRKGSTKRPPKTGFSWKKPHNFDLKEDDLCLTVMFFVLKFVVFKSASDMN